MNREEMKAYANRVIDLGLNDETQDFCKSVISALSAEGEYIKKEEFKSAIHNYFIGLNHNVTEEDIQAYIDALALYSFPDREKGEWIPVSERLPEEGRSVLVCFRSQGGMAQAVSERFNISGEWRWSALGGRKPLAWQPLPEPYKEGDKAE